MTDKARGSAGAPGLFRLILEPARSQGPQARRAIASPPHRAGDWVRLGASNEQRAATAAIKRAELGLDRHPADWQWRGF